MSNPEAPLLGEWLEAEPFEMAMSSGWLGVFAHTGAVKALKKHGLTPASARGSSAGAEVAGFLGVGMKPEDIEEYLTGIRREDVWDPGFGLGFLRGRLLEKKFREAVGDVQIQDLKDIAMPISISVTDVLSWRAEAITEGDLARTMLASSAFPFVVQPVFIDGRPKLDGGIKDQAGLAGSRLDERTFFHGLTSHGFRSRFDRGHTQAFEGRSNVAMLQIPGIPRVRPSDLEEGKKALDYAMEHTERALYLPVKGQKA